MQRTLERRPFLFVLPPLFLWDKGPRRDQLPRGALSDLGWLRNNAAWVPPWQGWGWFCLLALGP